MASNPPTETSRTASPPLAASAATSHHASQFFPMDHKTPQQASDLPPPPLSRLPSKELPPKGPTTWTNDVDQRRLRRSPVAKRQYTTPRRADVGVRPPSTPPPPALGFEPTTLSTFLTAQVALPTPASHPFASIPHSPFRTPHSLHLLRNTPSYSGRFFHSSKYLSYRGSSLHCLDAGSPSRTFPSG